MKKIIKIIGIILNTILVVIFCNLVTNNAKISNSTYKIKEMNESTQITDLNNQINSLNTEHLEYMNYIQSCKTKIATTLTNEGVPTSDQAKLETMSDNISKVLQERTKDATATADNITDGKTAYVNGELITGTGADNNSFYNEGRQGFTSVAAASGYIGGGGNISRKETVTHNLSSYEGYQNFEVNKNIFLVANSATFNESASGYTYANCSVSISYNKSTGVLTLKDSGYRLAIYYTLYVVY